MPLPGKPPSDRALLKQLGISPAYANCMCELADRLSDEDLAAVVAWLLQHEFAVRRQRAKLRAF